MPNVQAKAQKAQNNAPFPRVNMRGTRAASVVASQADNGVAPADFNPTLKDAISKVLRESTTAMDPPEVYTMVRRLFPRKKFAQASIQSVLSDMEREGTVTGVRALGDARRRYTIPPLASDHAGKSVPSQQVPQPDLNDDNRTRSISISMSQELYVAITALVQFRHGVSDQKAVRSFVQNTFPVFLHAEPYHNAKFFWTKFKSSKSAGRSLSVSQPCGQVARQITDLRNNKKDLVKLGIAMDDALQSGGVNITFTMIAHTSIIWYLATCLTEEEQALPAVSAFLDYAVENYRFNGCDVVEAYQLIHRAASVAESTVVVEPAVEPALADVIDSDADKPAMESPSESSQYGLTIKSDGADGLLVSLRLPPAVVGQLLCAVTDALEMLTRGVL